MAVKLSIIIVNWNGKDVLEDCLNSIEMFPPSCAYEIIIVDNDSNDGSVEWLKNKKEELGEKLNVVFNEENVGFGTANNQAMKLSDAEYFFLLNSDTKVRSQAIDKIVEIADSDPKIGVVGPKLLNTDGSLQASAWRNPPMPWHILLVGLRLYKIIPNKIRGEMLLSGFWDYSRQREVSMLSASALLVRRAVFEKIGGFDEEMHMYGEDCEYNLRIYRAGWKLVFSPDAEVIHKGGQSSFVRWGNKEKIKMQVRGEMQFQEKSLSKLHVMSNCLTNVFVYSLEDFWRKINKQPREDIQASLEVYREYIKKNLMKR